MRSCEIKINPGWILSETDEETCAVRGCRTCTNALKDALLPQLKVKQKSKLKA